jgi:hypothetical protein
MLVVMNYDFLNYFEAFCESTVWYKELASRENRPATLRRDREIAREFINERNRILSWPIKQNKRELRKGLNQVAMRYIV